MPSENTYIINLVGNVADPTQLSQPDSANPPVTEGRQGELLAAEIHGQFYTPAYRGKLFQASTSAATFPVVTATVTSVFTLYNPPGSGVNAELIYTTLTTQTATTVVNTVGWYFSAAPSGALGTFTAKGTVNSAKLGAPVANNVLFYTTYVHSGTPTLGDVVGGFGATTNIAPAFPFKWHNGGLILTQGCAISLLMSTAAGTGSAFGAECKWAEWPV